MLSYKDSELSFGDPAGVGGSSVSPSRGRGWGAVSTASLLLGQSSSRPGNIYSVRTHGYSPHLLMSDE